jgi:hypothetical protein
MSDDPESSLMLTRAEWVKKQEALVDYAANQLLSIAVEDFMHRVDYNRQTRIAAHVEVTENAKALTETIRFTFEERFTQWIVDNKIHF